MNGQSRNAAALGIAFVGGATGIVLLRWSIEDTRWSAGAATLLAVAVIIGLSLYYAYNHIDDREQEGDNLYYLGLLFTLVSLVYALVVLFWILGTDENLTSQTYELLGNFGVALLSTVAGIIARIFVQNYQKDGRHQDPTEMSEEEWERWGTERGVWDAGDTEGIGIGAAARALRHQLMMATYAFRRYNDTTKRMADYTRMHLHRAVETSSREMQTQARFALNDLAEGYQQVAKEAKKLQTATAKSAELMRETFEGFTGTITKANSSLEDIGQSLDGLVALNRQAKEVAEALSEHSGNLATVWKSHTEALRGEYEHIRQCTQDVQATRKQMHDELNEWRGQSKALIQQEAAQWSEQMQRVREVSLKAGQAMEQWASLGSQTTKTTKVLQAFEEAQTRACTVIDGISERGLQTAQETKKAQTATETSTALVRKALEELTSTITNTKPALERFGQTLEEHTENLAKLDRQTKATAEVFLKAGPTTERWVALEGQVVAATEALKALEESARTTNWAPSPRRWWAPWRR